MASYYVDISSGGSGNGSEISPWTIADLQAMTVAEYNGNDFFIKGLQREAISANLNGMIGAASIKNWLDNEPFALRADALEWGPDASVRQTYELIGAMIRTSNLGSPTLVERCFIEMSNYLNIEGQSEDFTITFKGCTIYGSASSEFYTVPYGVPESVLNLVFEDCLFVGIEFNTPSSTNVSISCTNCTFSNSEPVLTANFAGTISFDEDCRFEKQIVLPEFDSFSQVGGKYLLIHENYVVPGTDNLGPEGHDYSSSVGGLFGEPRRSVGAWLFRREFYCDVSEQTTGGDGLTELTAFGIDELQAHLDNNAMELDRIYCFGVGAGVTLALPTDLRSWSSLSTTGLGYGGISYYRGVTLQGLNGKFYLSEALPESINIGAANEIIDLVTDAANILATGSGKIYFFRSTIFNPGGSIKINASASSVHHFIGGCTFNCATLLIGGESDGQRVIIETGTADNTIDETGSRADTITEVGLI